MVRFRPVVRLTSLGSTRKAKFGPVGPPRSMLARRRHHSSMFSTFNGHTRFANRMPGIRPPKGVANILNSIQNQDIFRSSAFVSKRQPRSFVVTNE
ncbi:unnamed protein product [Toxocara canis]|nr:unnamed protein product [Toxocara canis]